MRKVLKAIRDFSRSLRGRFIYATLTRKSERLTRSEEVQVLFPGIKSPIYLRLKTSDLATFKDIFVKGQYDFMPADPPRIIIDAGANVGLTTLIFANRFPEARIIAVEPEPSNYGMLLKNTAPYDNVLPIQAAIWNENAVVNILDPGLGKWGFQVGAKGGGEAESGLQCRGVTIDSLMDEQGIDFIDILKMDIEGGEREVFGDAGKWIDRVGLLTVELHDRLREGCTQSLDRATGKFKYKWRQGENVYCSSRQVN